MLPARVTAVPDSWRIPPHHSKLHERAMSENRYMAEPLGRRPLGGQPNAPIGAGAQCRGSGLSRQKISRPAAVMAPESARCARLTK